MIITLYRLCPSSKLKTILQPLFRLECKLHKDLVKLTLSRAVSVADAVRKTTLGDGRSINPKFDAALNSLRQIINMQNRNRQRSIAGVGSPHAGFTNSVPEDESEENYARGRKSFSRTNLRDLPLPPTALVQEQLSDMKRKFDDNNNLLSHPFPLSSVFAGKK